MKGSYCLIINLSNDDEIKVGRLYDNLKLKKGYYVYIGSAMNSLLPRLKRHLSNNKKMHWHIDYLLKSKYANIIEILFTDSKKRIECDLADNISPKGHGILDFGCSDCNCNSHLIYFNKKEDAIKSVKDAYDYLKTEYMNLNDFKKLNK
ncbi:endonuclease [Methanobrevibacter sp. 87.7]|uniref:GIY-YIG nuclease family protein n=1 Tax=Methanobrevibacter sp. 87.7 TaxID=387957 RepID=UPI000B512E92|nr:GIY-YIG nuclease family protein [Methanobrevibacter sp. 87.7]OWT33240.1 endonuclease [Methanobrevibacter sp. 87.7]